MDLDSVLKQMRTEYTPNDDDRKRVENALTATIVAGSLTGAAHVAASSTGASLKAALAKGSLELLPVWLKGAIGVSATVAAVGGGVYGVSEYRAHRTASVVVGQGAAAPMKAHAPAPGAPEHAQSLVVSPSIGETSVPAQTPGIAIDTQTASRAEAAQAGVGHLAVRQAPTRAAAAQPHLTSLGELKLIGEASRALQDGRSEDAENALREHERRYAHTALGQERSGLSLLARCASDADGATTDATKFLQKNPNSPLATRIKRECLK